jgi:hypothetical protein
VPGLREVDLVRVADRHLPPGDLENLLAIRHADTITGPGEPPGLYLRLSYAAADPGSLVRGAEILAEVIGRQ